MTFRTALPLLALILPAPLAAQSAPGPLQRAVGNPEGLKLSGSFRVRWEGLKGQFRPGFDPKDDLVSVRTILSGEYDSGLLRFGAELYDSRAYGGEPGSAISANEVNVAEFVQAYVAADFDAPFGEGSSATVQAGRMTVALASRRLVSADDYRNTTNGFTGIRADVKAGASTATLVYLLPQIRLPEDLPSVLDNDHAFDRENFDTQLWGGAASHRLGPGLLADGVFLRLVERDAPGRPTRDRKLDSFGARLFREPAAGKLDFEIEGIWQRGSISASAAAAAPSLDVRASFQHAEIGYTFAGEWKPHLSLEYDRASGDGPGPRYGRFDSLYGMRRADLGPAGIYSALGRTNIVTPAVRLEVVPGRNTDAFIGARLLWAEEATDSFSTTGIRDATGASGRRAGSQVEGRVRQWIVPELVRAEVNGAWLHKAGMLESAPNAPQTGDTLYLSIATSLIF